MSVSEITYKYVGNDDWSRDLFKGLNGINYVDIDGELYTINNSYGFSEPAFPIGIKTPIVQEG